MSKANSVSARKAKGRNACKLVQTLLLAYAPELLEDDIRITSSSVPGEDIQFSPKARERYPFVIEVKCQESLNIWAALKQAITHLPPGKEDLLTPLLFFKRNNTELYVAIEAERFIKLTKRSQF